MTNPKRGELIINLGEKSWNSRVTMDGMAKIEHACGCGIMKVLSRLTEADVTTTEICQILLPVVKAGGNDVTLKDIQSAVWEAGLAEGMKAVGEILTKALMPEGDQSGNVEEAEAQ